MSMVAGPLEIKYEHYDDCMTLFCLTRAGTLNAWHFHIGVLSTRNRGLSLVVAWVMLSSFGDELLYFSSSLGFLIPEITNAKR